MNNQALHGVRVLDLSRVLAGPYCTMVLGDLGAEVIKVEPPEGDETRAWGPPFAAGESAYYLCINRNKRGMVVNLKTDEGHGLLRELALKSDVLIENFRPGTLARYGLDYDMLRSDHPRLVYCSISGFGQTGPLRDRPGYDFMIQAMGGVMSVTGDPEGEPMKVGVAAADLFAGQNAIIAILAALGARERTGEGQYIDIALFDSQLAWLANVASSFLISRDLPKRYGNAHPNIVPYQVFAASDGWFALAVGNDKQFAHLCELVGRPELGSDERFATNAARVNNREELIALLKSIFSLRSVDEWLSMLEAAGIPCGPINTLDKVFAGPQVAAREMLVTMEHPTIGDLPLVGSPLSFNGTPVEYKLPPPLLGQHTREILREILGYSEEEIESLKANDVIR
jgi:crotonobetainyl-CoA:carnitine CoA-transferase CaiB-like acyl-CoA transferase